MTETLHFNDFADYQTLSREAAKYIFGKLHPVLSSGGTFVLGMATGKTPVLLYEELLTLFRGAELDLSKFYTVNLDEYFPIQHESPNSYYTYMKDKFWEPLQAISPSFNYSTQGLLPNGEAPDGAAECARYEAQIKELGGINLQILGIGTNGHIGFNEPGSPAASRTRVVELAPSTIKDNSPDFGGDESKVPREAITMGIATILEAKEIVVLANGASKAPVVKELKTLSSPTEENPASFLLQHNSVQFFLDSLANGQSSL